MDEYFGHLNDLCNLLHTCPNCRQRSINHGIPTGMSSEARAQRRCWFCDKNSHKLNWRNGLDLNLDVEEEDNTGTATSAVPIEARRAWLTLQRKWEELSVVEEALVSRITACTSVLLKTFLQRASSWTRCMLAARNLKSREGEVSVSRCSVPNSSVHLKASTCYEAV